MPSSTSSSDPWRRFFLQMVGAAAILGAAVYGFIVIVDPFDTLPLSPPLDRGPVDGNARYAFPSLARNPRFDSAIFGTSTSRLLRPAALDPLFDAHFANLAMNSATAFEQARLLALFQEHHPAPRAIVIGLDSEWCVTPAGYHEYTDRPFPAWMYDAGPWRGYREVFDLYTLEKAGQAFAEDTGLKPRVYGRDGYTSFVPDDRLYDRAKVAAKLAEAAPWMPEPLGPDPRDWPIPALDILRTRLAALPDATLKLLYFVPYNHTLQPLSPGPAQDLLRECKRRVAAIAASLAHATVADFMIPSPITSVDDNYWDPHHYRIAIAERLAAELAAAARGARSDDFRLLLSPDTSATPP